jgi:hypothetical protein
MADASKLKNVRRGGLGTPPPLDEARMDLTAVSQPEHEPPLGTVTNAPLPLADAGPIRPARLDGRTMRRSGRTVQFATRVSPEFDERIRQIALREGMLLVEVLEHALDAFEKTRETDN